MKHFNLVSMLLIVFGINSLFVIQTMAYPRQQKRKTNFISNYIDKITPVLKLQIYYSAKTAAITEWDPTDNNHLVKCELINLSDESVFDKLNKYEKPIEVSFKSMLKLMDYCHHVDKTTTPSGRKFTPMWLGTLKSNIFPGTRWCGAGNVASDYHELGSSMSTDMCCRQHDFCPIMMESGESVYNLINTSEFTVSHCDCDDIFYKCLKSVGSFQSTAIGKAYFNIVEQSCIWDKYGNNSYAFDNARWF